MAPEETCHVTDVSLRELGLGVFCGLLELLDGVENLALVKAKTFSLPEKAPFEIIGPAGKGTPKGENRGEGEKEEVDGGGEGEGEGERKREGEGEGEREGEGEGDKGGEEGVEEGGTEEGEEEVKEMGDGDEGDKEGGEASQEEGGWGWLNDSPESEPMGSSWEGAISGDGSG